ncbi:MAG: SDR family NAD(P)-dependent oxidoreductase, partial [Dysgonamonadaceae bacterium]|nr:SDR family NAD(P)-dependent oxidoreductase [Dysgonamonadaceae bacterium]
MDNPFSLKNKTILVTGASSGIGKSIAVESSKMGASVIITGRNVKTLEETYRQLEGENHLKIVADMTKYEDIETIVQETPQIDGFSNNAGITQVVLVK